MQRLQYQAKRAPDRKCNNCSEVVLKIFQFIINAKLMINALKNCDNLMS